MGKAKGKAGHKAQTISQELRENELTPSVLPESFAGTKTVSVTFGVHNLDPGGELPIQHMDDPPVVSLLEARDEALYTSVFLDADSEAGPEFVHYIVANIPGKQADSRAGDVVLPYSAPSKHHGQHTHRYLVVVLEQPHGKLAVSAPKHRSHFKVQEFAKVHGLTFVGTSFFFGDWDATPPAQRKLTSASSHLRSETQTPTFVKAYSKYETEGARGQAMVTQRLAYDKEMIARSGLLQELVLEGVFQPRFPLHVSFEGEEISVGDEVIPQKLDRIPSVTFDSGDDRFYTLLLLDPDFPSIQTPTDRSVLVAMVINIPGADGNAAVGDAVWPFVSPGDLPGHTGMHRYLALLLEQDEPMERDVAPPERRHFDVLSFMKQHAPEEAEHRIMPIAAATVWLGTYKH